MMALDCGSLEFLSPFPLQPVSVDNSDFDELPVEERLEITRRNLQEVQANLRIKNSEYEDLQQEMKFHAIKNEELMDVVNAFRSSSVDRSRDIMKAKAEQNSELTLQNHALRDLLTKSGEEIAALQQEIREKTAEGESLSSQKRSHERLQAQLNDLVKTLEKVEVSNVDIPSEWINFKWIGIGGKKGDASDTYEHSKAIELISGKITAMNADRERLLKESKLYSQSDGAKEARIASLERQLRQTEHERDELKETTDALHQRMAVREGKIGALEELFQNINSNRTLEARTRRKSKVSMDRSQRSLLEDDDDDEDYDCVDIDSTAGDKSVAQTFEEMFVNIWTSVTGGSRGEDDNDDDSSRGNSSQASTCLSTNSYHTKQIEDELQAAARQEFEELQESHQLLNEDYESAQFKISDLSARLEETTIKANSFEKKAGLREVMLKDVIQQYKELQLEHSSSLDRVEQLKQKVKVFVQREQEREQERIASEAVTANGNVKGSSTVLLVEETPTFDMSERTERTSNDETVGEDSPSSPSHGLEKNFAMEDYERLETECDRLQHEFDVAIEKINELEKALETAKAEVRDSQATQVEQARKIALLEGEKTDLQERLIEASAKIMDSQSTHTQRTVQVEDELRLAELREQEARAKQVQREKDLWEVIEQYKKLADEKESTEGKETEAEDQMVLTDKVKIQKRDLVYEYRKMEKALEEAVATEQQLASDMENAKNEAAKCREETKAIRKRLAGCHSHYKQLREEYTLLQQENEELDYRLSEAQTNGRVESLS
ncbi:unnamed protein product [Pseudo-nitzschia multistriata]|uniref:Uncharacterized protein n=1 Tax=Pseudo-nitzschia multistriata TaxID=183589 RepID=A0A448Z3R6_9STRA|nr:unnamed protein product [Pseudo-nitzschia multistriata]